MERVTLGRSGLEVSPIAFGTWQLGGDWGSFAESEAVAAIQFAREQGVNLFDTAQGYGYGKSENMLGRALREELQRNRDEIVIATKGGLRMETEDKQVRDASREWLREGVEQSLRQLGVDHIDLYQVHWPDPGTPFQESAAALGEMVQEGKIRHVGVSNFGVEQMEEFSGTLPVETLQPAYSMFHREIEPDILPYARERDIGVLVYGPLAHGLLTGAIDRDTSFADDDWRSISPMFSGEPFERYLEVVEKLAGFAAERGWSLSQLAIAWTLRHPGVDVAIVGSRSERHIEESMGALDVVLSDEDMAEIDSMLEPVSTLDVSGPTPEMGQD